MNQSFEPTPVLSLRDIAAWQFQNLAEPKIIAGIPSLQRGSVWNAWQVELLWDSILRGFPIGALVVCKKLAKQSTHSGKYGNGWPEDKITHHLLDGQQRCNAIALGFLNALEPVPDIDGRNMAPTATLWIDLNPLMPLRLPQNSTRQFLFRVLTTAQPWGYAADDRAGFLGVGPIRDAVDTKYGDGKRPEIIAAWPHVSNEPIPFAWLTDSVLAKNLANNELWTDIRQRCLPFHERSWAVKAATLIECYLNGKANNMKHFEQLERGLLNLKSFNLVALEAPQSALEEQSWQEKAAEVNEPINDNRIYNVEHLFQRLNSAGTELRGEELTFSMIKAYWPSIEQSFDAIQDKRGNKCLPMPGSRLATLGARAALIGCDQYTEKDKLPGPLSISSIRSMANAPNDKAQAAKERLEQYLGIMHLRNKSNVHESELHKNLQQIDDWLLFNNSIKSDYGLPPVLRTSLAQHAPDVFLLLLHLARKAHKDKLSEEENAALRKPILGLVTALHWFGDDRSGAVGNLYSSHFSKGALSPDSFSGVLKHCLQPPVNKRELFKLLSPVELGRLIPEPSASDEKLSEWTFWRRIIEVETNPADRAVKERDEWQLLAQVRQSKPLLLYAQRAFLSTRFCNFDPSCIDIWEGHNRPWDYDHILASATLKGNHGQFRNACREWADTIGNFRAWPLERNRSRHDQLANTSIFPDEFTDSFILNAEECEAFSLTWYEIQDSAAKVAGFMNAARSRILRIYKDWFDSLEIVKLLSDKLGYK